MSFRLPAAPAVRRRGGGAAGPDRAGRRCRGQPGRREGEARGTWLPDRLRLRHLRGASAGGDGRVVGAVAVLRRRHLHRRQQPGVQGPARAHRRLGQQAAAHRLAPAADPGRPAGELLGLRRPHVVRPDGVGAAGECGGGSRHGRRHAGPRHRCRQHALLRPRGLRHHPDRLPPGRPGRSCPAGPRRCRRSATGPASTPTSPRRSPRSSLADVASHGSYTMPDDIWFAWSNEPARHPDRRLGRQPRVGRPRSGSTSTPST